MHFPQETGQGPCYPIPVPSRPPAPHATLTATLMHSDPMHSAAGGSPSRVLCAILPATALTLPLADTCRGRGVGGQTVPG